MRSTLVIVAVLGSVILASITFLQNSSADHEDEGEAAKQELERQNELAKKELEMERELAKQMRESEDDDRGLNLSLGRLNLANMTMLATIGSIVGVAGYAGYRLASIRRKVAQSKKKA